jgi:phosphate transport system protein
MTQRTVLERGLTEIRDSIVVLGSLVESAIDRAITALRAGDLKLAQEIVEDDERINQLRFEIEDKILLVFATQQPMARDLRALAAAINIIVDLERMGDHAAGIARTAIRQSEDGIPGQIVSELPTMADKCREMLRECLDAYVRCDVSKSRQVAEMDHDVDHLYNAMFTEVVSRMRRDDLSISQGTYMLWTGHNLERIADRVTNICERIIFANTGTMRELNV